MYVCAHSTAVPGFASAALQPVAALATWFDFSVRSDLCFQCQIRLVSLRCIVASSENS